MLEAEHRYTNCRFMLQQNEIILNEHSNIVSLFK